MKKITSLMITLTMLITVVLSQPTLVNAAAGAEVTFEFDKDSVDSGEQFVLTIKAKDVQDLYGYEVNIDLAKLGATPVNSLQSVLQDDGSFGDEQVPFELGNINPEYKALINNTGSVNNDIATLLMSLQGDVPGYNINSTGSKLTTITFTANTHIDLDFTANDLDNDLNSFIDNNDRLFEVSLVSSSVAVIPCTYNFSAVVPAIVFEDDDLTFGLASPQPVNTRIRVATDAAGGNDLRYYYVATLNGQTAATQAWTAYKAWVWEPTEAGTYTISVHVADASDLSDKTTVRKTYTVTDNSVPAIVFEDDDLTFSVNSPQPINSRIRVATDATGGNNLRYYYVATLNGKLKARQAWTAYKAWVWEPTEAGTYTISVHVADASDYTNKTTVRKTYIVTDNSVPAIVFEDDDLTFSLDSPQPTNARIRVATDATGGNNLRYYYVASINGQIIDRQPWTAYKAWVWEPSVAGTYTISVHVADASDLTKKQTVRKTYTIQ